MVLSYSENNVNSIFLSPVAEAPGTYCYARKKVTTSVSPVEPVYVDPTTSKSRVYYDAELTKPVPNISNLASEFTVSMPKQGYYVVPTAKGYYNSATNEFYLTEKAKANAKRGFVDCVDSDKGTVAVTGAAIEPGSFAGNPYTNVIPPDLNTNLLSASSLPSGPSDSEAIAAIIACNCDKPKSV